MSMSDSQMKSPVAHAIWTILELFRSGEIGSGDSPFDRNYLVVSYRKPEDFNFLWNFWQDETPKKDHGATNEKPPQGKIIEWLRSGGYSTKHLFLVWDGLPKPSTVGNIYLGTYVTPFDWLIALASCLTDDCSDLAKMRFCVSVLDTTGGSLTSESAQIFRQVQDKPRPGLPWIRVYEIPERMEYQYGIQTILSDTFEYDIGSKGNSNYQDGIVMNFDTRMLRRLWVSRIVSPSKPRDRHTIANLVGPQLLTSGMTSWMPNSLATKSPCLAAFLNLMRALKLLPQVLDKISAPWIDPDRWKRDWSPDNLAKFVLVDDMADLGWKDFLCLALGIDPLHGQDSVLFVSTEPDAKVLGASRNSSLIDLLADASRRLRVNEGIDLFGGSKDTILFLDLRLFNRRSTQEEFAFLRELLALAEQAEDKEAFRRYLPWRGFTHHELNQVRVCVNNERVEDEGYFIALTLLPRLIALVDPMLPIVLFSSTGQRRVSESLKGYGSIITDFDKPRFFGSVSGNLIEESRQRFERAINHALTLIKGRTVCRQFQTTSGPSGSSTSNNYVEIFIDEADEVSQEGFRVGGVAIIYDDEKHATKVNEEMTLRGLTWGSTDIDLQPQQLIDKRMPLALYEGTIYTPVENLLRATQVRDLIAFTLAAAPDMPWVDTTDLTSPWCLDNQYRNLVCLALEVLFYEILPEKTANQSTLNYAVYLASRTRYQSDADAPRDWDSTDKMNIAQRYGVRLKENYKTKQLYFQSIGSDSVHPIITQVRALMPEAKINITVARANTLRYGIDPDFPEDLPRPAHLLADLVVSQSNSTDKLRAQPTLNTWLTRGFTAVADDKFIAELHACRHARAGRHVEAILDAYKAVSVSPSSGELAPWAKLRIGQSVDSLSGRDFISLCRQLPENHFLP